MVWLKLFNGILVDLSEKGQGSVSVWKNFCPFLCSVWLCGLVAKLRPTLCESMDCSPPGSSVHEISQARILEWIAISFSRDLPNPGVEPRSPALQEVSCIVGRFFTN